jgi:hypothetical protein
MALGRLDLVSPLRGRWPFLQYDGVMLLPKEFSLDGRTFRKAVLKEEKPGVLEQYREHVAKYSFHLYVMADGSWTIDHRDEVNPDIGGAPAAVMHFLVDHPVGQALTVAGICLFVGVMVAALVEGGGGAA